MGRLNMGNYEIPKNVTPRGYRCITVMIPDDDEWENIAYSCLYDQLARTWTNWKRTGDRTGQELCLIWRTALRTWKHCDSTPLPDGMIQEEFMAIKTDCDCVTTVDCPSGGTQTLANKSDVPNPINSPNNAPQPSPGGGSQQYCRTMQASGKLIIPTLVNTGDKISLTSATGQGNDAGSANWYCPDGSQYFGNQCVGGGGTSGGDPLPTSKHMAIIININGLWYDPTLADIIVPGGVVNAQIFAQVNDSNIFDNSGTYDICVTVTNNQAKLWSHVLDFEINSYGFSPTGARTSGATWLAGTGFIGSFGNGGSNPPANGYCDLSATIPSTTINHIKLYYSIGSGGGGDAQFETLPGSHIFNGSTSVGDQLIDTDVNQVANLIGVNLGIAGGASPAPRVTKLIISGSGIDPFPTAP